MRAKTRACLKDRRASPLLQGFWCYFSPSTLKNNPKRTTTIAVRILVLGAIGAVARWEARPWYFLLLQAGLGVLQVGLLHLQLYYFGTDEDFEVLGIEPTGAKKNWKKLQTCDRLRMRTNHPPPTCA